MYPDALNMSDFYRTVTGGLARRVIIDKIDRIWGGLTQSFICGVGFTEPFLDILKSKHDCLSVHSVYSGVCVKSESENDGILSILSEETQLPLADNSQKHILCSHLLEHVSSVDELIKELSRITTIDGDIIFIIPNRRGLWARFEHTPFGNGKPYGKKQFARLLENHNLFVTDYYPALFFPPKESPPIRLYVNIAEYIGEKTFLWRYGGVHIIRVVKRSYIPPKQKVSSSIKLFPNTGRLRPVV